jgi:hypothetical protein
VEEVDSKRVIAFLRTSSTGRASGIRLAAPTTNVYDPIDGKNSHIRIFLDRQEALKPWGWRSNGQEQVSRERATSANARHECFVMDASVSVRIAETAEMDELREHWPRANTRPFVPGEAEARASPCLRPRPRPMQDSRRRCRVEPNPADPGELTKYY